MSETLGARGERAAATYLESRGLEVLALNWRCRVGEVDIIARDDGVLVLCEVKTRRSTRCGTAEEAVDPRKRRRLTRLGRWAQNEFGAADGLRFDVIAIDVLSPDRARLAHYPDAFGGEDA